MVNPTSTACCVIKINAARAFNHNESDFGAKRSLIKTAAKVCSERSLTDAAERAKENLLSILIKHTGASQHATHLE